MVVTMATRQHCIEHPFLGTETLKPSAIRTKAERINYDVMAGIVGEMLKVLKGTGQWPYYIRSE
jgi:hypothetical protein